MDPLRALARRLPSPIKAAIKRRLGIPLTRLHPDFAIVAPIGPAQGPHVVVDAGAHNGWFFHVWRDWCPQARVHAFEPAAEAFAGLQARYGKDESVTLNPVGLGARSEIRKFQVMKESRVSNSFLQHVPETWARVGFRTGAIETRDVQVTTLSEYLLEKAVDRVHVLKIDVQGLELDVLQGAEAVLDRIDHILVESQIQPLYQGAPGATRVWDHLTERGFHLMDLRAWHRGNHVLMETDMLFRRDALAPPVDGAVERIYTQAGGAR